LCQIKIPACEYPGFLNMSVKEKEHYGAAAPYIKLLLENPTRVRLGWRLVTCVEPDHVASAPAASNFLDMAALQMSAAHDPSNASAVRLRRLEDKIGIRTNSFICVHSRTIVVVVSLRSL